MKLNEIKTVVSDEYNLLEGVIPPHITLTLQQVIDDKMVTNSVQTYIMAALIEMFKGGGPYRWPREINDYSMATNSELIEKVQTLSDVEATSISAWLLDSLQFPANFEANPYGCHPHLDPVEWVRWVLKKQ